MSDDILSTVRILELMTRTGIEVIKLGSHCSLATYRKLRDIYHAHVLDKAGEMSYGKLLKHVGSDTQILNFETDNKAEIDQLKSAMTDYKISFVVMPDLCVGDGQTQFLIDASDASKAKAFLQSYTRIPHKEMTADEYAATGTEEQWDEIHEKAVEEKKKDAVELLNDEPEINVEKNRDAFVPQRRSAESLIRIRREELFRQSLQQPGAFRLIFDPAQLATETSRTMIFRLGDGENLVAISRDEVRKDRGRYTAVILPDKEYALFKSREYTGKHGSISHLSEKIRGDDLIMRHTAHLREKTEKKAEQIIKDMGQKVLVEEKQLQR